MSKIITVFGATGNQGGSVIKHILADSALSKEFQIRGVTRDVSKPAAKALAEQGVELVSSSVVDAIRGSHTVFLVTNYWESANTKVEVTQGKNVADAAKEVNVSHIIFSSLLHVTKISNGRLPHVPHFDGKADIEEYIRGTKVPCTFVLPGYFMTNFPKMMQKGEDGSYTLAYPISHKAKFPLFHPADTGIYVNAALKHADKLNGKQLFAAADYYTPDRILSEFEEVTGKKARYVQVTAEQYKAVLPDSMAEEFLENHLLIEEPGYYNGASLDDTHKLLSEHPTTWKEFVKEGAFN